MRAVGGPATACADRGGGYASLPGGSPMSTVESPVTIVVNRLALGPTAPGAGSPLLTRVGEVVAQMGPPPWSRRIIADERNLVTLIASPPGGGNRPHWHRDFDEWWVVLDGVLEGELTGGTTLKAVKDDIVEVPAGTVHRIRNVG